MTTDTANTNTSFTQPEGWLSAGQCGYCYQAPCACGEIHEARQERQDLEDAAERAEDMAARLREMEGEAPASTATPFLCGDNEVTIEERTNRTGRTYFTMVQWLPTGRPMAFLGSPRLPSIVACMVRLEKHHKAAVEVGEYLESCGLAAKPHDSKAVPFRQPFSSALGCF